MKVNIKTSRVKITTAHPAVSPNEKGMEVLAEIITKAVDGFDKANACQSPVGSQPTLRAALENRLKAKGEERPDAANDE